ncbi:MAG: NADH-dependent alcohol dehydrogenase [SAR324 cluster bacterium]|uniref:NADH-dependent alcohol dehydrogenase n=1 Tax=SAR324 cluster bacterium TaxID=2024889 RepID=A0A2A4SZJ3_9DELT|nr:MAG: NADH-dependent alcohol dehydrogenase [SAR324 cluster bacterium]
MLNFEFKNPTKIIFGKGEISKIAAEIPKDQKILITYGGGSIKKNGVYEQVMQALQGHEVLEFSGIEPNPTFETLSKAVTLVQKENVDFLLAVGGGSVLDGTKFIAAAACFEGDSWDLLAKQAPFEKALPLGAVLTLPATGSESNGGSVITKKATQTKLPFGSPLLFPQFSVLDPTVTYSLPEQQISNGIVDAFVHVVEQYLTYPVNASIQDRFAEGLLLTLIEEGPKALENQEEPNYEVRANLMWAATMALNGLIGKGVPQDWATHMIGHELTALHGIDHARSIAIILPNMMQVRRTQKRAKLLQYAERVWNITTGDEEAIIDQAIQKTREFFESVGVPTRLGDYGVKEQDIPAIIEQLTNHRMVKLGEQREVTPEVSRQILELSL